MAFRIHLLLVMFVFTGAAIVHAQEPGREGDGEEAKNLTDGAIVDSSRPIPAKPSTAGQLEDSARDLAKQTEEQAMKIAKTVDQDPRAKTAAAGILQPIYVVAEALAFPAFHWLAFGLMSAGVVSYVLQLLLGKLVVLMRMGFSLKEIASDAIGLAISVVGLVLTTQAAAENSSFTQSPSAVISASIAGALLGIVLYFWGQSQELEAAAGRSRAAATKTR